MEHRRPRLGMRLVERPDEPLRVADVDPLLEVHGGLVSSPHDVRHDPPEIGYVAHQICIGAAPPNHDRTLAVGPLGDVAQLWPVCPFRSSVRCRPPGSVRPCASWSSVPGVSVPRLRRSRSVETSSSTWCSRTSMSPAPNAPWPDWHPATGSPRLASTRRTPSRSRRSPGRSRADVVVNACDPRLNPPIFDGAFAAGCTYLDMAMHLSKPHPDRPYEETGREARRRAVRGERSSGATEAQLALVGIGVEPGLSDVFARYAADHLFSSIDEVGIRDGANLVIDGLRLRADVLDLDDDRGVPQPAGDLGARPRAGTRPRRSASRRCSSSPRASDRSSASTSSTRRCCSSPAGSTAGA